MIRGTSPSVRLKLPFDGSLMKTFRVLFSQKESLYLNKVDIVFVKESWECSVRGQDLIVKLRAEETSMLDPRHPVEIRVELVSKGEVLLSKPIVVPVDDFWESKHINNGLDGSIKVMNPYEVDFGVLHDLDYLPEHHNRLCGRDAPNQHPIEAITGLKEALREMSPKVFGGTPGALVVTRRNGSLKASDIRPEDLLLKRIAAETYATKDLVEESTEKVIETTKELINSVSSEVIEASVVIQNSGETVIPIPEPLKGYKNLLVYQNGKLLVKDMHYLMSGDFISLINYIAYATDVFTFMYVGRVLVDDANHEHPNLAVLDSITQDMVDGWNAKTDPVTSIMFNRAQLFPDEKGIVEIWMTPQSIKAAPEQHTHADLVSTEELFSNGKIKESLLPESLSGGLELGETAETAFRGDHGALAYEHSLEKHAPVNAQENVIEVFQVASVNVPIKNKVVNVPIATVDNWGVVKSSNDPNKVRVEADGTMTVSEVKLSSLVVEEGEELVLVSGDSSII